MEYPSEPDIVALSKGSCSEAEVGVTVDLVYPSILSGGFSEFSPTSTELVCVALL